ncbi:enoyl-CoA hydratase/isomerase family protein [Oceanicoccus sp. KOV_DT_Chl]|uniref:enoyl-CoA hydratase/isomerase family protein n=1 Tax=Oceanicoccus sp. KOV_DT_Chl TaxID=1904639 RepID=UPI000C79EDD4|nr:enoyl-CoA hydratase/isomerase family protein [Oceanicoccus sp. KOV_DT_Chl]
MPTQLAVELSPNGVLRLTMNRPEVHNAFDDHQAIRLIEALDRANDDPAVRVVVLASSGKSFSAGGDLNYMKRMSSNSYEENLADAAQLARLMKTLNFLTKPTVARVQGATFGGAVGLVSCCDIAIGTPNARFALSEVKVGMAPATIAPYVVRAIGTRAARRFFTTAEVISAEKALAIGLLSEVVSADDLDVTVDTIVESLLKNAPTGMQKAKQIIFDVAAGDITESMIKDTVSFIADIRHTDEGREGLSAFLEKRPPNWT